MFLFSGGCPSAYMADREQSAEVKTVEDLLDEIEDENLYQALLTVDRRTLQIVLLSLQIKSQ